MALIETYFSYTQKYKDVYGEKTLVLMQVGAFFEVYGRVRQDDENTKYIEGSNILDFCSICDLNMSEKVKNSIVMAGFRDYGIDKYIVKLQNAGYTCVVYIQSEADEGSEKNERNEKQNGVTKKEKERVLDGIYSPGTYFNTEQNVLTNTIMCIRFLYIPATRLKPAPRIIFGMSTMDVLTGQCNYYEHGETFLHNPSTYDELEKYYTMFSPSELLILFQSTHIEETKIYDILQFIGNKSKTTRLIDLDYENVVYMDSVGVGVGVGVDVNEGVSCEDTDEQKVFDDNATYGGKKKTTKKVKKVVKKRTTARFQAGGTGGAGGARGQEMSPVILSTSDDCIQMSLQTQPRNISLEYRAKNCEKEVYKVALLKQYYKLNNYEIGSFIESTRFHYYACASHSFCFLLDFLYTHNPSFVEKIQHPTIYNKNDKMLTANHSLKQLNFLHHQDGCVSDTGVGVGAKSSVFGYGGQKQKMSSVISFLNNCVTHMGKRKMNIVLMNPITNIEKLKLRYDVVSYMYENHGDFMELRNVMKGMKDMEKLYRKIVLNKFVPCEIYNVYTTTNTILYMYSILERCVSNIGNIGSIGTGENKTHLSWFLNELNGNELRDICLWSLHEMLKSTETHASHLHNYIVSCFDVDTIKMSECDTYTTHFFRRGIYEDVDEAYKNYLETEDKLRAFTEYLTNCMKQDEKKSNDTNYCKIHETEKSGICIKTTETRYKKLMDYIKKEVIGKKDKDAKTITYTYTSSYDGKNKHFDIDIGNITKTLVGKDVCIRSHEIDTLCDGVTIKKGVFARLMRQKFKFVCEELKHMNAIFTMCLEFTVFFDVMSCAMYNAYTYNYCKPVIQQQDTDNTTAYLKADDLRHILIEQFQKADTYVANDIVLGSYENKCASASASANAIRESGSDKDGSNGHNNNNNNSRNNIQIDKTNGILLYGTNAVGKSSLIKSIGICVILAQCGMFVPCSRFQYYPFQSIFTRILGNDNIFKGLSTFAVEMSELNTILRLADENSLILGDELCSGTELGSALSIFSTGLYQLHQRGSKFIFATHFHEITNTKMIQSLTTLKMKHMSVLYDEVSDTLIYDRILRDGPGNNMYGLEVCKALHLPSDFLELAYKVRCEFMENSQSLGSFHTSKYNSRKIMGQCEMCGKRGTEIHHILEQKHADERGFIHGGYKHKNHMSNLLSLCEECHKKEHLE